MELPLCFLLSLLYLLTSTSSVNSTPITETELKDIISAGLTFDVGVELGASEILKIGQSHYSEITKRFTVSRTELLGEISMDLNINVTLGPDALYFTTSNLSDYRRLAVSELNETNSGYTFKVQVKRKYIRRELLHHPPRDLRNDDLQCMGQNGVLFIVKKVFSKKFTLGFHVENESEKLTNDLEIVNRIESFLGFRIRQDTFLENVGSHDSEQITNVSNAFYTLKGIKYPLIVPYKQEMYFYLTANNRVVVDLLNDRLKDGETFQVYGTRKTFASGKEKIKTSVFEASAVEVNGVCYAQVAVDNTTEGRDWSFLYVESLFNWIDFKVHGEKWLFLALSKP